MIHKSNINLFNFIKITNALFVFFIIHIYLSCNSYNAIDANPHSKGCTINAYYGQSDHPESYRANIRSEVVEEFNIQGNFNEILYSETVSGQGGIYNLVFIFFSSEEMTTIKVTYQFTNRKPQINNFVVKNLKRKDEEKILNSFNALKNYGEWNLSVKCFSGTDEQELIFYVKENDNYLYFASFENFDFYEIPSIGIDKNVMEIINIIRPITWE